MIKTLLLMSIGFIGFYVWYLFDKESSIHLKVDFDLFVAEKIVRDYDVCDLERGDQLKMLPSKVFRLNDELNAPEVKWHLPKNGFETLDSLTMGITNESSGKFYYMSWGVPNSRLREDLIIYRSTGPDTIMFDGFGCGTGIYLQDIEKGTSAIGPIINPLCLNPYNGWYLPLTADTLPNMITRLYGDSVSIRFRLATYSLPWSKYDSGIISSPWLTISTEKIIANWHDGKYLKNDYRNE